MADIKIYIANEESEWVIYNNQFIQYRIDMRYDFIADSFTATLVDQDAYIRPGYWMHFVIDDKVEFRGLIEKVSKSVKKSGRQVTISGRSKPILLVQEYYNGAARDYNKETNPRSPYLIIGDLIGSSSFLTKSKASQSWEDPFTTSFSDLNTAFNNDLAELKFDRISTVEYSDEFMAAPAVSVKIDPGATVWTKINQIVNETKFEVLYQDEVLFFGDLQKVRQSKIDFSIVNQTGRINAISTKFEESITNRYSTVNLFGQPEYNWTAADYYTNSGTCTDSSLLHKKFYCAQSSGDLENKAIKLREDQRYTGYRLVYVLPGHLAPNGAVWKINRYVSVLDDFVGVARQLVIYGRSFIFSQTAGTTTELTLSIERSNVKDL